jgi:hypothetical protein
VAFRLGRDETSGLELGALSTPIAIVFAIRNRKVTRLISYWDRDLAFADLGLAPRGRPVGLRRSCGRQRACAQSCPKLAASGVGRGLSA